jgi:putative intracellular protease/amidase
LGNEVNSAACILTPPILPFHSSYPAPPLPSLLSITATPYLAFKEKGFDCVIASIKGGEITYDAGSLSGDFYTADCKKFAESADADLAKNSKAIADIKDEILAADALYIPGGHACYTDHWDATFCEIIAKFYADNKPIAVDCHGPACLCNPELKKADGTALVAGHDVCCFTDAEETALGALDNIPYSMEQALKALGANFKGGADWTSTVVVSGNLITGQNPASSKACADALLAKMA